MVQTSTHHAPKGLLRIGFRIPVYIYRLGLGWVFGERLVLVNHVGRKSGTPRQSVVEVIERNLQTGEITIIAGYGSQTQWYQNLKAHPDTTIQLGRHRLCVISEFVSAEDGEDIMARYFHRHSTLTHELFSMLGYSWDGTEQGARKIARETLRFVRFRPTS